ncbi:hypothetical protein C8Q73DRAFT_344440 [Cubamyces lactineus]|nr:hypothetical protein C8Q73DRAFT_344440 [Cubamyces lactineus]
MHGVYGLCAGTPGREADAAEDGGGGREGGSGVGPCVGRSLRGMAMADNTSHFRQVFVEDARAIPLRTSANGSGEGIENSICQRTWPCTAFGQQPTSANRTSFHSTMPGTPEHLPRSGRGRVADDPPYTHSAQPMLDQELLSMQLAPARVRQLTALRSRSATLACQLRSTPPEGGQITVRRLPRHRTQNVSPHAYSPYPGPGRDCPCASTAAYVNPWEPSHACSAPVRRQRAPSSVSLLGAQVCPRRGPLI